MRTYVLGAGASFPIYPLGGTLLDCIDTYIQSCGRCFDRFQYDTEWPAALAWLQNDANPVLREAYRSGNIEQIFTALDFAHFLRDEGLLNILRASRQGPGEVAAAEANYDGLTRDIGEYREIRQILLWAMEAYFQHRHEEDRGRCGSSEWMAMEGLGQRLAVGDVVVTFNYDSMIERVLLRQDKWSPKDGYGSDLVFCDPGCTATLIALPKSKVKVLHLHGAVGWYRKPHLHPGVTVTTDGGALPREALSPASLDTEISLDPLFLQALDIPAVDASMPERPSDQDQILLHPSFMKDYGGEDSGNNVFRGLWKKAADALRASEEIVIVGYSLPAADAAAWTLLLTSCVATRITVVDPSPSVVSRYGQLLRLATLPPPTTFDQWLRAHPVSS
jgi:hypothetical protein